MKTTITLDEKDIKKAISCWLKNSGKKVDVSKIYLRKGGVENSPDPREYSFIYAEAEDVEESTL